MRNMPFFLGITPARAGKSRTTGTRPPCIGNYPRSRGEELNASGILSVRMELPPLARGREHGDTTPKNFIVNYPRSRGEEAMEKGLGGAALELPPLARGRANPTLGPVVDKGITPARAGKRPSQAAAQSPERNYPRSRGEEHPGMGLRAPLVELPPLARGRALPKESLAL